MNSQDKMNQEATNRSLQNTSSVLDDDYYNDYHDIEMVNRIYKIAAPIIVPVGTIAFLICFPVLVQMAKTSSFYIYLSTICILDLAFVYVCLFVRWLEDVLNVQIYANNLCSYSGFAQLFLSHSSSWLAVIVSADRLVAVSNPLKARIICTTKRTIRYIVFTLSVIALINGPMLYFAAFEEEDNESYCTLIYSWLDVVIYFLLSAPIVSVINILIVKKIAKAKKLRSTLCNKESVHQGKENESNVVAQASTIRTTMTLFLLCALFVLFSIPLVSVNLYDQYNILMYNEPGEGTYLLYVIMDVTLSGYHSLQMLLLCISGKNIQNRMIKLYCCKKLRRPASTRGVATRGVASVSSKENPNEN